MYTIKEIAIMTQLTTRTLQNHLKEGLLQGTKIGHSWRFTEDDIKKYMNQSTVQSQLKVTLEKQVDAFVGHNQEGVLSLIKLLQPSNTNLSECISKYISENITDGLTTFKAATNEASGMLEITIIATMETTLKLTQYIHAQIGGQNETAL